MFTLNASGIKPFSKAPSDEQVVVEPMNEMWLQDGSNGTGLDKGIFCRPNITGFAVID